MTHNPDGRPENVTANITPPSDGVFPEEATVRRGPNGELPVQPIRLADGSLLYRFTDGIEECFVDLPRKEENNFDGDAH